MAFILVHIDQFREGKEKVRLSKGFQHKKRFGQNFLRDERILSSIVVRASLMERDVVLEVGAGKGVLTEALLSSPCCSVHSVEIDRALQPFLARLEDQFPEKLSLHWQDAVKMDFGALIPSPTKVVANIPYNITTPLLWRLLETLPETRYYLLMVQKEAAERITAPCKTKERYPLGVTLEVMGSASTILKVPAAAFYPVPKVESQLLEVRLSGKKTDLPRDLLWREMLREGFLQRRKKLVNNLRRWKLGLPWEDILRNAGVAPGARAEELSGEQWVALLDVMRGW